MLTFPFNTDVKFTILPKSAGVKIPQSDMVELTVLVENKNRGVSFAPVWGWSEAGIEVEIQREDIPIATSYSIVLDWRRPDGSFSDNYQDLYGKTEICYVLNACPNECAFAIVEAFPSFKGDPGSTPVIGENGNWWIDGKDTGKPSKGKDGEGGGAVTITSGTFAQAKQQAEGLADKSAFFEFMLIDSVDGIPVRKMIYHVGNGVFIDSVGAVVDLSGEPEEPKTYYTVTFQTDGGSPVPNPQSVEEGKTATAPANPSKSGYTFLFWSLDGASAYNFQTPVNGNITLTAKWQEESIPVEYWQVGWNLNGGAWPSNDNHATQVVKGGTLSKPNDPTKSGNIFEGWYAESALTNKIAFPYTVSGDIALYAKWTEPQPEEPNEFKFTAILTEDNQRVYVPLSSSKTSNISVDWGDGSEITNYQGSALKGCYHDYTGAAGDKFQITVSGTVSGFRFDQTTAGNPANLYSIDDNTLQESVLYFSVKGAVNLVKVCANAFQNANITELSFQGCTSLNEIEEGIGAYFEGKGITSVTFQGCSSLTVVPDDFFEHVRLPGASYLFYGCKLTKVPASLKQALINCTTLYYMFQGAGNECNIPNDLFDLCESEITDVRSAFAGQSAASKSKMTGDAKALYDVLLTKVSSGATTAGCFANSDMPNRNLVPTSWGGTAS